jgi:flagellar biosynthesis protein FlhF
MADVLSAVKRELGRDAVIVHTRTFKLGGVMGIGARSIVEVIAGAGKGSKPAEKDAAAAARRATRRTAELQSSEATVRRGGANGAVVSTAAKIAIPQKMSLATADTDPAARVAGSGELLRVRKRRLAEGGASGRVKSVADAAPEMVGEDEALPSGRLGIQEAECAVKRVVRMAMSGSSSARAGREARWAPSESLEQQGRPASEATRPDLEDEVAEIKRMVGQMLRSTGAAPAASVAEAGASNMPEALYKHYLKLLAGEVAKDLCDQIVGAVRAELTDEAMTDDRAVRAAVLRHLAARIPVAEEMAAPMRGRDGRPRVLALVGPTGVGKTTTVAKLAAAYRLKHGRSVGLITCDTYRIAAVEQLKTYASIIGVPLKVAMTPEEMAQACRELGECDVILIDTAGRSPSDDVRLEELRRFLNAAQPHETHLVLSSAASQTSLLRAAGRFAPVAPNKVIFTKLDEAVGFGVLLNVAHRIDADLSFVTTGQQVPDHIEAGRADRLARLVLEGEFTS